MHLHFLAAGCLFTWVIAGPDPAPRRPSVAARLVVLGVTIAVHASLAQLLYAGLYVQVPASADELRGAAALMYYGGDVAELLLAFALVTTWRPRRTAPPANRAARMARSTGDPGSLHSPSPCHLVRDRRVHAEATWAVTLAEGPRTAEPRAQCA